MRIIVAGIGEVGTHLATMLSDAKHDVVAIDPEESNLQQLHEVADVVTLQGSVTSPTTLKSAHVEKTDLFVAVAHAEETNIIGAMLAKRMGTKQVVARIDNNEYLSLKNQALFKEMGIDSLIYPEKLASQTIISMLGEMGGREYIDFSDGKLVLTSFRITSDMGLCGMSLKRVDKSFGELAFRVVALLRDMATHIPNGDCELQNGDVVYVIANQKGVDAWRKRVVGSLQQVERLMVVGGSRMGARTCLDLEDRVKSIKLIESNAEKCKQLEPFFTRTLLLHGDGRDVKFLQSEGLDSVDAFVAVTGNSETNILMGMAAKQLGVRQIIAEVENLEYMNLAMRMGIDNVVNKKLVAAARIYRYTLGGDITHMRCLMGTDAEVLELVAQQRSAVTRGRLKDLNFPRGAIVGGIVHDGKSLIATGETVVEAGDRAVVFAQSSALERVTRYFSER